MLRRKNSMAISGIVISFTPSIDSSNDPANSTLVALDDHPKIEVGERFGPHLPCVLDTQDVEQDRELVDWIQALPAVEQVQVAYVAVDEEAHD